MTKLEKVLKALLQLGFKAKMKNEEVAIRGFRFKVKGDTVFTYNHKGDLVAYGLSIMTALAPVANK